MASLIYSKSGGERFIFPMGDAVIIIGRDSNSDLLLKSIEVSRNHASIVLKNGQYTIRDNGSQNGTFVNGIQITSAVLSHNDRIKFGPYVFLVDLVSVHSHEVNSLQNKINVSRGEQSYKSSLKLPKLKGHDGKEQSVELIMSKKVIKGDSYSHVPITERAFQIISSVIIVALILWISWLSYLGHDAKNHLAHLKSESESQIDELKKMIGDLKASDFRLKEEFDKVTGILTSDLARIAKDISSPPYTSVGEQTEPVVNANNSDSEQVKPAGTSTDTISKAENASTSAPDPISDISLAPDKKPLDYTAFAQEMGIPVFEPQPLLLFPKKVTLNQELKVPFIVGNNVKAFKTIPAGQSVSVQSATEDSLQINFSGEVVTIPKTSTDFLSRLESANAEISKANDNNLKNWQETIEDKFKELENAKSRINIVIRDIWENQIRGVLADDGTSVYVSGLDTKQLVSDQRWIGFVYLLGYKSNITKRYRVYTASAKEFVSSKASQVGANEAAQKIDQLEGAEKPTVKFDELQKIYEMADPLKNIRELRLLLESKKPNMDYDLKKFCQGEQDKWTKVSAEVIDLCKNKMVKNSYREWLKQVAKCAEMNQPERLPILLENLVRMDRIWVDIKVNNDISDKEESSF